MKLYIGNLPYDINEVDLREALSAYEPIEDIHIPLDRDTGSARGFAFVRLSSQEIGEKAIEELNGNEICGRTAKVSEAIERDNRGGGGGGGYGGGGGGGGPKGKYRKEKAHRDKDSGDRKRYGSI